MVGQQASPASSVRSLPFLKHSWPPLASRPSVRFLNYYRNHRHCHLSTHPPSAAAVAAAVLLRSKNSVCTSRSRSSGLRRNRSVNKGSNLNSQDNSQNSSSRNRAKHRAKNSSSLGLLECSFWDLLRLGCFVMLKGRSRSCMKRKKHQRSKSSNRSSNISSGAMATFGARVPC